MHVLTSDHRAKNQLSLLLHDLGDPPRFFTNSQELCEALSSQATEVKTVLLDTADANDAALLNSLKSRFPGIRLVGFELYARAKEHAALKPSPALDSCILLPAHAERAKARLRGVIRQPAANVATNKTAFQRLPLAFKRPASKAASRPLLSKGFSAKQPAQPPRYLTANSTAAARFIDELVAEGSNSNVIRLTGEEGGEFELAARELNYQFNHDQSSLRLLNGDDLTLDSLEKIERQAKREGRHLTCYVGRTDEWDHNSSRAISLFIEYLDNLRNPHIRLILADECGSEAYFKEGVADAVRTIRSKQKALAIPPIRDRAEDIPAICHSLLANLRMAHPFLLVDSITEEAIAYLVETRTQLSHAKIVRTLRNAIALSQRNTLHIEDLKNYGESDTTTQHLLESMADEGFFPTEEAANY